MSQSSKFLDGEGDAYFWRNPLTSGFAPGWVEHGLDPFIPGGGKILEIGCGEGRRLAALREIRPDLTEVVGVDPSKEAIAYGQKTWPELDLRVGVAEDLSGVQSNFDLIFYGFCLYLCDRSELFAIADAAQRRLKKNGVIAILDFDPPQPARRSYAHLPGLWSYKMDYSRLWTANPEFTEVSRTYAWAETPSGQRGPFDRLSLVIIRRQEHAYLEYHE